MNAKFNASAPATKTAINAKCRALAHEGSEGTRRAARELVVLGGQFAKHAAKGKTETVKLPATANAPRRRGAEAPRRTTVSSGHRLHSGPCCLPRRASAARMQSCTSALALSSKPRWPRHARSVSRPPAVRAGKWWLTLRSSRAPTAWRASHQALGLRPILRLLSGTPRCRCRLSSNVRRRKHSLRLHFGISSSKVQLAQLRRKRLGQG